MAKTGQGENGKARRSKTWYFLTSLVIGKAAKRFEVVESVAQDNGNTAIERANQKVEGQNDVVSLLVTAGNKAGGVEMTATRSEIVN